MLKLRRKRHREPRKLEKLYAAYRNRMYYWALNIVKDKNAAEDIVGNVMVRLSKRGISKKVAKMDEERIRHYLEAMTKAMAVTGERNTKKPSTDLKAKGSAAALFQNSCKELRKKSQEMSGEQLAEGVEQLSVMEANLLSLQYVDRFTNREISRILGIRKAEATRRLAETQIKLIKLLEGAAVAELLCADKGEVTGNE